MTSLETIRRRRNERVDSEGTPPAIFLNDGTTGNPADIPVDTNNGGWIIDFEDESKTKRLTPMSTIVVNNNSSSDLNIYANQRRDWQKIVRAQTVQAIKDFKGVRSVRISKRDATVTTTAGQVEVAVEREPLDDDEFRRRQLKKPLLARIIQSKFLGLGG